MHNWEGLLTAGAIGRRGEMTRGSCLSPHTIIVTGTRDKSRLVQGLVEVVSPAWAYDKPSIAVFQIFAICYIYMAILQMFEGQYVTMHKSSAEFDLQFRIEIVTSKVVRKMPLILSNHDWPAIWTHDLGTRL